MESTREWKKLLLAPRMSRNCQRWKVACKSSSCEEVLKV